MEHDFKGHGGCTLPKKKKEKEKEEKERDREKERRKASTQCRCRPRPLVPDLVLLFASPRVLPVPDGEGESLKALAAGHHRALKVSKDGVEAFTAAAPILNMVDAWFSAPSRRPSDPCSRSAIVVVVVERRQMDLHRSTSVMWR